MSDVTSVKRVNNNATKKVESHLHDQPSWVVADHIRPSGREEVWRFSPMSALAKLLDENSESSPVTLEFQVPNPVLASRITPEQLHELADGIGPVDRISALAAHVSTGATCIEIPAGTEVSQPIVLHLSGNDAEAVAHQALAIKVGNNAKATVVLQHSGSLNFASFVAVVVGDGAEFNLVSLQQWEADAVHGGQVGLKVGRDAQVKTVSASLGGNVIRLVENAVFAGPGGKIEQFGLYFADAHQHIEHRLFVDHNLPNTHSNVDYRGALQGEGARTVWVGDVLIRPQAEGISTYEANKNLVLTDGCRADSVPNLEIETGEIEGAGHSSTTGRFDDEQLFYLRSRGISETEARRLVVNGFFVDIIRRIGVPTVEESLTATIATELDGVEL